MLKETINYKDFNGEEQSGEFYFNLSEAELIEIELGVKGGSLTELLKTVIDTKDGRVIVDSFKRIIHLSYGRRSPDGARFVKNAEILEDFTSSGAYSVLFTKMATNAEYASTFINGIMPGGNAATALKNAEEGVTAAEAARARSEAALQGHKTASAPAPKDHEASGISDVQEPVQELRSVTAPVSQSEPEDLTKLTKAQLLERLNSK